MANTKKQTLSDLHKSIKILPLALIAGLCLMSVVVVFLMRDAEPKEDTLGTYMVLIITLLAATGAVVGSMVFRKTVAAAVGKPLADKLVLYRQGVMIRFAMLELPALIGIGLFFFSGNYLYMIITGAMVLFMLLNRPTDELVAQQLNLTESDKALLTKK